MSMPSFVTFSINEAPSLMPFRVFHSDFSIDGLGCGASRASFIAVIASAAIVLFALESSGGGAFEFFDYVVKHVSVYTV